MRYVAKIHVLDVLDEIVVSGYVYDADGPVRDGEPPLEFTLTSMGKGLDDPRTWLVWHLYDALQAWHRPAPGGQNRAGVEGVRNTISESGDKRADVMG